MLKKKDVAKPHWRVVREKRRLTQGTQHSQCCATVLQTRQGGGKTYWPPRISDPLDDGWRS